MVRCSVTFNKPRDLLFGLKHIHQIIKTKSTYLKEIVRIKNRYYDELNVQEPHYADCKLNILFCDSQHCMIVEV